MRTLTRVKGIAGTLHPANKQGRGNTMDMTNPLSIAVAQRDSNVLNLVREALDTKNVMLAFQPIIQTERPDCVAFYEGLIRIMDKTGRIIPAREFIDVVETDEIGRKIDCLSLQLGIDALRQEPNLRLSINMSARSIGYKRWMRTLNRGLRKDPTIGERLILEITESSAMIMPDVVRVFMADLQDRGVSFALDDFGAGYTAFRYLRDFYFDILKIDAQGAELRVIRGAEDIIKTSRPTVMWRSHKEKCALLGDSVSSIMEILFGLDYQINQLIDEHSAIPVKTPFEPEDATFIARCPRWTPKNGQ